LKTTLILTFSQWEKERCWLTDDPKLSAGSSLALSHPERRIPRMREQ